MHIYHNNADTRQSNGIGQINLFRLIAFEMFTLLACCDGSRK